VRFGVRAKRDGLHLLEHRPDRRRRADRQSSKRVHDGEPVVPVPCQRYVTDSITWIYEVFPGATQRIGDPIKDSNPLRNRDRHQLGTPIAIPRNPQAILRRAVQIDTSRQGGSSPIFSADILRLTALLGCASVLAVASGIASERGFG